MIRVNLGGAPKTKAATAKVRKTSTPTNALPILHLILILGTAAGGYLWYSNLSSQAEGLSNRIASLQAEQKRLDGVIKQNQIYEARKGALESRIRVIEDSKKNQLSPVVVLDALADAIDRTRFVWLSSLSQNNTTLSMAGTGTSVDALSDFVANLKGTKYFRNINLARFDDAKGNYTFSMTTEFSPPTQAKADEKKPDEKKTTEKGGN
jgi:Tfp pilus assembly protein PilN